MQKGSLYVELLIEKFEICDFISFFFTYTL